MVIYFETGTNFRNDRLLTVVYKRRKSLLLLQSLASHGWLSGRNKQLHMSVCLVGQSHWEESTTADRQRVASTQNDLQLILYTFLSGLPANNNVDIRQNDK